jgi:hypothetical protein
VTDESNARRLVYGVFPDAVNGTELIFVPEREAHELAQVHGALSDAETWGDVKASISPRHWQQIADAYREDYEPPPADDDAFDRSAVPGLEDGDWPEWPAQEMLRWMPEDIRDRFGEVATSTLNGELLLLQAGAETELVAALRDAGFDCRRDDALVSRASGY